MSFSSASLCRGYCPGCRSYSQQSHRRAFVDIPPILVLDAALERYTSSSKQLWAIPNWLPEEIGININTHGDIMCFEGDRLRSFRNNTALTIYELVGFVAAVDSTTGQKPHLVSFINGRTDCRFHISLNLLTTSPVTISERTPQWKNQWYLFNDFLVKKVDKEEASSFPSWKTPIILTYQLQKGRHNISDTWKNSLDITCLYYEGSLK